MKRARKAPRGTEAALKRAVVAALKLELRGRGKVLRLQSGHIVMGAGTAHERRMSMSEPGTPDLLVMLPGGRTLWIELKTETGRVTDTQHAWHEAAHALGHDVIVCRSVLHALQVLRGYLRESA
jgi:hypothetical protein